MAAEPMEVDPIDDGPTLTSRGLGKPPMGAVVPPPPPPAQPISKEDEARQAIDMLRGEDVSARVAAANRLEMVASALGSERTRSELLPFLADGVDDEDEVLVAIAISLGKLIDHVGGAEHTPSLLPPLELLLTVEESTVRDAASLSTQKIAEALSEKVMNTTYADMVTRLAEMEWFTARISAASLIAPTFGRLSSQDTQDKLLKLFCQLCRDETPMVRRVAAQHLGAIVKSVASVLDPSLLREEDSVYITTLMPLYEELASNEQPDAVRLQTTENCVMFGSVLGMGDKSGAKLSEPEEKLVHRLLPLIVATIDDRSWRVRWTAASKFANVIEAYDQPDRMPPAVMEALIPAYEKLLQDPEAEVRTAATLNLAAVAKCRAKVPDVARVPGNAGTEVRVSVAERLVKRVTSLTEDDSEHVRAALALVATELAPVLGKAGTISNLVPPVLLLLRDAASEVRLNLISSLSALNEVIGVDLLSQSLLPAILDLAQDGKWRIRLAIIQHIPQLANQLGMPFFSERLSSLCVGWLGDDIASIREAAARNLQSLTALFGTEWAIAYLLQPIQEIRHHGSYLRRLTAIQACALMANEMDADIVTTELLPMVLEMSTDSVANIRFNVAKGLEQIGAVCGPSVFATQIRPVLLMLNEDPDRDVLFFAEKTLKALEEKYPN